MTPPPLVAAKNTRLFLHERNVSCHSTEVDGSMTTPTLDATTFCGVQRAMGVEEGKFTIRGYWASDDPILEERLSAIFVGTVNPAYFCYAPYCAANYPCYGGQIKGSSVKVASPVENLVTVDGELMLLTPDKNYSQGFGSVHRGRVLYYAGDDGVTLSGGAGTTNGTATQVGASIGGKLYAHFHLSWVPPLTDYVTVTLQHSANGTTGWANFTGVSIVLKAEAMGPGATVLIDEWNEVTEDAYWRVVLTRTGSNAKLFFNLYIWAQVNTGAGTEGTFVIVEDSDSGTWVTDVDSSEYVIK